MLKDLLLLLLFVCIISCKQDCKKTRNAIADVLSKAQLPDDVGNPVTTVTCPLIIGVGETLDPERKLTSTTLLKKILTTTKVVTCKPLQADGEFDLKISTYLDSSYSTLLPVQVAQEAGLSDNVYYEISLRSEYKELLVTPKYCYATAYPNPNDKKRYVFLKNGCPLDETYQIYPSTDVQKYRFSIESFRFIGTRSKQFYVHCEVTICDIAFQDTCNNKCENDMPRMNQVQASSRTKRDLETKALDVSLECGQDFMSVAVKKPLPNNVLAEKLHLLDTTCKPSENSTHVFITTKTFSCGTKFTKNGLTAIYENVILEKPNFIITRKPLLEIPFKCSYKLKSVTSVQSLAIHYETPSLGFRSRAFGTYTVDINLFQDSSFKEKSKENVVQIDSDKDMFFEVKINSPQLKLGLFLDECFGYPARRRNDREEYAFIRNGCGLDDTLKFYKVKGNGAVRFSLKPFMFSDNTSSVIINCYVTACNALDKWSKCRKGCNEE